MKAKSTLAKNIEVADDNEVSLDRVCKKLLANKSILAWILKTCVEEYAEYSPWEIGRNSEDSSMTEGTVTYDIRFSTLNPMRKNRMNSKGFASMKINVEGQTNFYPGYPLSKRGIYYGSRMISAQYGTVFTRSHYEKLEKVYSIWVCLNPPKDRKNSINVYSFQEKQLLGSVTEKKENYDLITLVMICLGDEEDENCKGLIRLLSVLLSTDKSADEKKEILETEFNIEMTETMEEEAEKMGEFSKYVKEKSMQQAIKNLIKNANMTLEQAMAVLEVPENDRGLYAEKISV